MKLLRIFVYVVLRLPVDIYIIITALFFCLLDLPKSIYWWAEGSNDTVIEYFTPFNMGAIPFYTTIKTVREIWQN